jgi:hypothetical protein
MWYCAELACRLPARVESVTVGLARGCRDRARAGEGELFRSLDAAEIEALGPMPAADEVTPTTDRDSRTAEFTGEVRHPGIVEQSSAYVTGNNDPFAPPRSLTEED